MLHLKRLQLLSLASALAGALTLSSALAQAPDGLRLGHPEYGGSGCPAGTASASISPDGQTLSILFDSYQVKAGGFSGQTIDRKSCNVAIPVHIPSGYSVSIINIDYRGFNSLVSGAVSRFNAEYFFAGQRGMNFERNFYGPLEDDFLFQNRVSSSTTSWSACGEQAVLRTNTGLTVQVPSLGGRESLSSVDSADVRASVVYTLQYRRCDGGGGGYPPNPGNPGNPGYPPNPGNPGYPPNPGNPYPPNPGNQCLSTYEGPICVGSMVMDRFNRAQGVVARVDSYYQTLDVDYSRSGYGYRSNVRASDVILLQQNPGYPPNPGNPGYPPQPPYPPNPGNPGYPPQPPRPGNPGGGAQIGTCTIQQGRDARGQSLYRVMAQRGAVLVITRTYGEAVDFARASPQCRHMGGRF